MLVEKGLQRSLCNNNENHEQRGPERRQLWRETLNSKAPDQHYNGQKKVQPGLYSWANRRQFAHVLIRIVFLEFRKSGGIANQADIDQHQQRCQHPHRRFTEKRFRPADPVIHHQGQHTQADEDNDPIQHPLGKSRLVETLNALHVQLAGLKVHDINQCHIGNHRREDGVLDDLQVGDTHIFDHQESGRAHDGRCQLAVG